MNMAQLMPVKENPNIPDMSPGDTVKVSSKIVEGGKERLQMFQGVVLKLRRGADGGSFTVRRVSHGIGVERTFPMASPLVDKVQIVRRGRVRRARLYYLRERSGKAAWGIAFALCRGKCQFTGRPTPHLQLFNPRWPESGGGPGGLGSFRQPRAPGHCP